MYSIKAVSTLTGITAETLRAWERRYGIKPSRRDANGRRLYSEEDVHHLQLLREAVASGHPIGRIATCGSEQLVELLGERPRAVYRRKLIARFVEEILRAADTFQPLACERALAKAAAVLSYVELAEQVLAPALHEVGLRWERGEVSVAQEHMVSIAVLRQLHVLFESSLAESTSAPLVFATPAGELHELGLLSAGVVAANSGRNCVYLGPNVPLPELGRFCHRAGAIAVACSCHLEHDCITNLNVLRAALPDETKLIVGGHAVRTLANTALPANTVAVNGLRMFAKALDSLPQTTFGDAVVRTAAPRKTRAAQGSDV